MEFYEKLYFTELLYQRKIKARDRKENFTIKAPPQSCFVTVSVFVGISVDVSFRQGIQNRLRWVCAMPFDPTVWVSFDSSVTQEWTLSAEPLLTAADLHPVCFCADGGDRKGREAEGTSRLWLRFCPASLPRGLFPFDIQTSQASITGFTELLARECTIDW